MAFRSAITKNLFLFLIVSFILLSDFITINISLLIFLYGIYVCNVINVDVYNKYYFLLILRGHEKRLTQPQ